MSREYPDWLDPWKAAEGRRTYSGSMPLARMGRLAPLLASSDGQVEFTADFAFDQQGRVTIDIEVQAELPLVCQRSLEVYLQPVRRKSLLGVMEDMAEEAMMPDNYEPVVANHGRLALLDLVEDELLLGLPQVPRNPRVAEVRMESPSEDPLGEASSGAGMEQPFAGLAEQMKRFEEQKKKGR